jgi:hypothetical protein
MGLFTKKKKTEVKQQLSEFVFIGKNFQILDLNVASFQRLDELLNDGWQIRSVAHTVARHWVYLQKGELPR